jgi:hypothetical protein
MLISDTHRLILMLPEKCCSSTLEARLKNIHTPTDIGGEARFNHEINRILTRHIRLKHALRLQTFKQRSEYLKACFVRNPYDRAYSWFGWIKKAHTQRTQSGFFDQKEPAIQSGNNEDPLSKRQLEHAIKIRTLLNEADYDFNHFLRIAPEHFRLNSLFTHEKKKCIMNFIGHVERFEVDFSRLCNAIGFQNYTIENINIGSEQQQHCDPSNMQIDEHKYLKCYNSASVAHINHTFKLDFKYFGYKRFKPKLFPKG